MRCENHIKTKRTGRGYTLAKLEKLSGVSDSHISQLERGRNSHRLKWHIGYQKLLSVRFWNYLNFTNKKGEKLELEQTKHKYKYRVQGENYRNGSKNE